MAVRGWLIPAFVLLALGAGRAFAQFELHERPFFGIDTSTAPPTAPEDLFKETPPLEFSQDRWNRARRIIEEQEQLLPPPAEQVEVSSAPPAPKPPELVLPEYGTSLSVTGRKVIGFNYTTKEYLLPQTVISRPRSTSLIDINQALQIRMQGKVGPKITVNVDYDDTKAEKQDISVVYKGDPQEVVQEASFGDIDLSLPATEFVSYNKQLFGIRANLKSKDFSAVIIASRTKGTTKSKRFVGNSVFTKLDIPDTNYIRRQYYDLTFGNPNRLPLKPGSERVWIDQQNPNVATLVGVQHFVADDLGDPSVQYSSANFQLLGRGQDYTVDYVKGILTLRSPTQQQFVLAVDFTNVDGSALSSNPSPGALGGGGTGNPKLIKTSGDQPLTNASGAFSASQIGWSRELKTFYQISTNSQIIRDNGQGNFILKVVDAGQHEVGSALKPPQTYPATINVNFEQALFSLTTNFPDGDIYAPTPVSHRLIHVEFSSRIKTFTLEPSIVPQSESIVVDGQPYKRNVDYFIDYDVGFLTFFNPDKISPTATIDVTYDVAPFGGLGTESLFGSRVGYNLTSHWAVGSTLLYQSGSHPPSVPSITDLPRSLLVYEFDSQLKDIRLAKWLTMGVGGEVAQSRRNPNIAGFALVDNMEGVKKEDSAVIDANFWFIAANPTAEPADPKALAWSNTSAPSLSINPNANVAPGAVQQVMDISYNFGPVPVDGGGVSVSTEVSIVYPFSSAGLDFSQKSFLEVQLFGNFSAASPGPEINFHLGSINEDADGTGGTTLTCNNQVVQGAPKTEDLQCDGILHPGEDIGWLYNPAGKNSARYGAGNGRIDTEDLNHNGRLDAEDFSGCSVGYNGKDPVVGGCGTALFDATEGSSMTVLAFKNPGNWQTFQIPLNITTATAQNWATIRQIRISLRRNALTASDTGKIRIARVSVVGNTWLQGGASSGSLSTLDINAVNNVDNPSYPPIFNAGGDAQSVYTNLYGSLQQQNQLNGTQQLVEQSLALTFHGLPSGASSYAERRFTTPVDISQHQQLRFLLYPNAAPTTVALSTGNVFFFRFGTDTDYYEVHVPLANAGGSTAYPCTGVTCAPSNWLLETVNFASSKKNGVMDSVSPGTPGMTLVTVGNPSLQQIGQISAGVANLTGADHGASNTLTVWLDEVHLAEPSVRVGNAHMFKADFDIPGWASFGAKTRSVDLNFQTPVSVVSGQDNEQDTAYLNIKKPAFFPTQYNLSRTVTNTPNAANTGQQSNLISSLQQGKVTIWTGSAAGTLSRAGWPKLTLGYDRSYTNYEAMTREDNKKNYKALLSMAVPKPRPWQPKTTDLNYTYSTYDISFRSDLARQTPGNYNTHEATHDMGAKLSFEPWQGTSIKPSYTLKLVRESRTDFTQTPILEQSYPKSLAETVGFTSSFQFGKLIKPTLEYSVTNREDNNLSSTSFLVAGSSQVFGPGDLKTVNRQATGKFNLPLSVGDMFPKIRLLKSMNIVSGYQLQDGEVWNNVERGLSTLSLFWIRSPFKPGSPVAAQQSLTQRDTLTSTLRWSPLSAYELGGRLAPLKTLNLSNSFTYSKEHSEVTGTPKDTKNLTLPDVVASINGLEQMMGTQRFMGKTQLNLKYSHQTTRTEGVTFTKNDAEGMDMKFLLKDKFDTALSANNKTSETDDLQQGLVSANTVHRDATVQAAFSYAIFKLTPRLDWTYDYTASGGKVVTQQVNVYTPSLLARADINLPAGIKLPFMSKPFVFTNRVIWTTNLSYAIRRSPVTQADNSNLLNLTTSADYEIAKNLRMALNGNVQRLWHKFLPEEEFLSYQIGSTLTFQF